MIVCACALAQTPQTRPLTAVSPQKGGAVRLGQVMQSPPEPQSSIMIACESRVELMVVDPKGRKLGGDPNAHKSYDEIPAAYYEAAGLEDDETGAPEDDPPKTMFIPNPISGSYHLSIAGTGKGVYTCSFSTEDLSGAGGQTRLEKVPISEGELHNFVFEFDGKRGSELRLDRE